MSTGDSLFWEEPDVFGPERRFHDATLAGRPGFGRDGHHESIASAGYRSCRSPGLTGAGGADSSTLRARAIARATVERDTL